MKKNKNSYKNMWHYIPRKRKNPSRMTTPRVGKNCRRGVLVMVWETGKGLP